MADARKGGDIFDMAKDGTKIPGDAGKQNVIKSVPNIHQRDGEAGGGFGATTLHEAADNSSLAADEGRPTGLGEGITGTGNAIPQSAVGKPGGRGGTQGSEDIRAATGGFATKNGRSNEAA
ncbi:uncharacterized protein CTRU02_209253 [Colletotrichum truncatum]|uniref:Uncharacterized protein n=1 Tax=Colletotrichum truncatum TaxID=5467 RepID=A0ACC3YZS3_COLTU|nr:uncharacterized protein CTRU02_14568 [Colletotrichum truncatum]KAF6782012.1 hypothetical protein CTRU02_14568 [Colletotrichum truncatum]